MSDQSTPDTGNSGDNHEDHGHGGLGVYMAVFAALCVLTLGSFLTYFDFWDEHISKDPRIGRSLMMAISCTKASLVILFFMHLKWEASWKYILTFPSIMMSVFLILMLTPDIGLRSRYYNQQRWIHAAEPSFDSHGDSHLSDEDPHEEEGRADLDMTGQTE